MDIQSCTRFSTIRALCIPQDSVWQVSIFNSCNNLDGVQWHSHTACLPSVPQAFLFPPSNCKSAQPLKGYPSLKQAKWPWVFLIAAAPGTLFQQLVANQADLSKLCETGHRMTCGKAPWKHHDFLLTKPGMIRTLSWPLLGMVSRIGKPGEEQQNAAEKKANQHFQHCCRTLHTEFERYLILARGKWNT